MKPIRVATLTRYGVLGASSRLRVYQYSTELLNAGLSLQIHPLFSDDDLNKRYAQGSYGVWTLLRCYVHRMMVLLVRRNVDVIWIEKEAFPWWPLWAELALLRGVPFVLDYDDAVFHNYDQHRLGLVRRLLGRRLDGLMARAALVVGGNGYLAERARHAGAKWVEVLPTVIDLKRYPKPDHDRPAGHNIPRIVWIGSPTTAKYLSLLSQPLLELAQRTPFVLRVIGAEISMPGVQVECIKWSEATEVAAVSECAVGVMPLEDSLWERGKCGYKLIQYMACGLPVVASHVGVNSEIVQHGVNGFLVRESVDWIEGLEKLLGHRNHAVEMGQAGRQRVEDVYCLQKTGPILAKWLIQAAENS